VFFLYYLLNLVIFVNGLYVCCKDELQTTSRSYEGQLSMMSEHLAAMNERLTQQKDEIDVLKYQLEQQQHQQPGSKVVVSVCSWQTSTNFKIIMLHLDKKWTPK